MPPFSSFIEHLGTAPNRTRAAEQVSNRPLLFACPTGFWGELNLKRVLLTRRSLARNHGIPVAR